MPVPLISTRAFGRLPELIEAGSNRAVLSRVFEAADLPETVTETQDQFIPQKKSLRFLDRASHVIGDRDLGISLAPHITITAYGDWSRYVLGAPSLKQALVRSIKAMKFHVTHYRFHIEPRGDEVAFTYVVPVSGVVGYRHFAVSSASLVISLVRAFAGANWHPLRVELDIPRPPSSTPYEDLFRCPVIFDRPGIAVIIDRHALNYGPLQASGSNTVTYSDLRRVAERPAPTDLVSVVRELIQLRLLDGIIDIDSVARHLELGPRTLQRRLNDEGTAYRALVSQVRAQRAIEMLRETESPMIDIAVELGYSSSSHFSRAFRKTVGLLPSDIRRDDAEAAAGDRIVQGLSAATHS